MQGRPAKLDKQIKESWVKISLKVIIDIALIVAIFYAGYIYGGVMFGSECPSIELVKSCYVNTNQGVMSIDTWNNITGGIR